MLANTPQDDDDAVMTAPKQKPAPLTEERVAWFLKWAADRCYQYLALEQVSAQDADPSGYKGSEAYEADCAALADVIERAERRETVDRSALGPSKITLNDRDLMVLQLLMHQVVRHELAHLKNTVRFDDIKARNRLEAFRVAGYVLIDEQTALARDLSLIHI